ncbi:PREDICTED: plant UBX domain-containing protein 7 [Camelina sativa]|uniref:UBX domain-containing protein n=1 Tax=Camelina sativa TaxID=90675 RepID=A0ABM0VNS7_CAMSA|nr:PREDICTED: plant UBX domain-containing protein 7 [Camelina sativa]XP_010458960.1 PREDICTED: plant UBX domain-containing protein 7 [Camelina sativa]XP_010458961.1 PREDICTED: plant UBX domain-containing protein 7 [Camelina sativa]
MEGMLSSGDEQRLVSSFLEIAVGQTAETARQFLQATSWKLDEAIQLFYIGNEGGMLPSGTHTLPESNDPMASQSWGATTDTGTQRMVQNDVDEVRAPLPVVRETLYGESVYYGAVRGGNSQPEPTSLIAFRNFSEEPKSPGIWEPDEGASSASASESASVPRDSLASLYRPPFHLMFQGSFEMAKATSSSQDKWLLVNLQSTTEFSSHMLNRDTWANDAVSQTIKANFIFWQVYDDTTEGRKVCTYYKLESIPVVLVIDPTTGQRMRMWSGMVEPENLLEDLVPFMDGGPREHFASLSKKRPRGSFSLTPHSKPKEDVAKDEEEEELRRALAASLEDNNMKDSSDDQSTITPEAFTSAVLPAFPPLPEEPKGGDRSLQCRVGIRLPNGQRLQRNFLKTDTIQLLWSFCYSQLEESERKKPLKLTQAIPGESKTLEYESNLTLEQSGVANSMISATWE